jgi:hypothetical protein
MSNSILLTVIYTVSWFVLLATALMVFASYLQYKGMSQKNTKALFGLGIMIVLWLFACLGLTLAQAHFIDLTKKNVLFFSISSIVFDYSLINVINQWTIANVQQRIQRILRWMITGIVVVYGLFILSAFIFVRS